MMQACSYSFQGSALSSDIKSVSIATFPNEASLVVPTLSQTFSESLRDRFIRETNLNLVSRNGDIEFEGAITNYNVSAAAVQENDQASLSRLTIAIKVKYTNNLDESVNFEKTFSSSENFDANQNLSSVEDQLIEIILDRIIQDIFNASVNNW